MAILAIETSCDETAASCCDDGRVLASAVASSADAHKRYGGIIPEIASRAQVESIVPVVDQVLRASGLSPQQLSAVAVTMGPGLAGSLLVGVSAAKALSWWWGCDLVGVNHLQAHLHAAMLDAEHYPAVGLVISGGHTSLVWMEAADQYELLGQTTDDAVGESYDKVAKMLNLGYPGGPIIDRRARSGQPVVSFPRAQVAGEFDMSYSGLKTAVLYHLRDQHPTSNGETVDGPWVDDVCASFQEAALEMLVERAHRACRSRQCHTLVVGGGVSANSRLRDWLTDDPAWSDIDVHWPSIELATDNAVMIGVLGERLWKLGYRTSLDQGVIPNLPITEVPAHHSQEGNASCRMS